MVDFSNTIQMDEQQGADQRGGFRTVDQTFWGDAISNTAKAGEIVADSMVASDTAAAEAEIKSAVDRAYFASGLNQELEYGGLPSQDIQRFQRLYKAAQAHGGNKGKLYTAQLASLTRDLRNKFPSADVDKLIEHVSGINPYKESLRQHEKMMDRQQKEEDDWKAYWNDVDKDPAKAAIVAAYGGIPPRTEETRIRNTVAARQAEYAAIEDMDKRTVRTARRFAGAAMKDIYLEATTMFSTFGKSGMAAAMKNPQSKQALTVGIATLKTRHAAFAADLRMRYPDVDPSELDKIIESSQKTLNAFEDAVTDGDINMANALMQSVKWGQNEDAARWISQHPDVGAAAVIAKEYNVPFIMEKIITDKYGTDPTNLFAMDVAANVIGNNAYEVPSFMELATEVKSNGMNTDSETVMSQVVKTVGQYIADPSADPARVAQLAETWMGKGKLDEAAKVFNKSPVEVVSYLTQPAIMQSIAKKTPVETRGAVLQGLVDFMNNPEIQRIGNNLASYTTSGLIHKGGQLMESEDGSLIMVNAAGQPIPSTGAIQSEVRKMNTLLRNLKTAHEIMGKDWDEVKANVFLGMNIRVKMLDDVSDPQNVPSEFEMDNEMLKVKEVEDTTMIKGPAAAIAAPLYQYEGTNTKDGYDALLAHSQRDRFKGLKPTEMTIGELKEFARGEYGEWSKAKKRELGRSDANIKSTPVGKYQILAGSTLGELQEQLGLPDDTVFTPEVQDRMFLKLLEGRGWNRFLNREITPSRMARELISEWEGFGKYRNLVERLEQIQQQASMS